MLDKYWQDVVDNIYEYANDLETLQIAYLLIIDEIHRLSHDLDNNEIKKEFNTLSTIEIQIRDIINNYV